MRGISDLGRRGGASGSARRAAIPLGRGRRHVRLSELPRSAIILVLAVGLAGLVAVAMAAFLPESGDVALAVAYLVIAFLAASRRIPLQPTISTLPLGFVVVLGSLFSCGTGVAAAAAVLNVLGSHLLRPQDREAYRRGNGSGW